MTRLESLIKHAQKGEYQPVPFGKRHYTYFLKEDELALVLTEEAIKLGADVMSLKLKDDNCIIFRKRPQDVGSN